MAAGKVNAVSIQCIQTAFQVKVSDAKTGDSAYSSVLVKISDISSNDIWSSTLVRITGISATNFIQLQPDQLNLISRFSARLAHIFSVNMTEVKIASVVPGDLHIDIFYAVRNGTGHFAPLLLDTILTLSRRTLETELSADVKLIGLQTCVTHGCPGRCENFVTVGKRMSVIERIGRSTLITPTATVSLKHLITAMWSCINCTPGECPMSYL